MEMLALRRTIFLSLWLPATSLVSAQQAGYSQNPINNHIRLSNNDNWSFGVAGGSSFGLNSNETNLFRGNSLSTKLFGRYYFGTIGLGVSGGIIPGSISSNALNQFIADRKFPQDAQSSTIKPANSYLLFGPSIRFGNRVEVDAGLNGGLFYNNPGAVSIGQQGATRSLYRFDAGSKNLFPGFSGAINIAYPINSSTRFFINTDYIQSQSSIRLYDPQRGIDVPNEQNRDVKLFTVGIGITKSFGSKRDMASGQASGKRTLLRNDAPSIAIDEPGVHVTSREMPTGQARGKRILPSAVNPTNLSPREAGSGMASGKRTYRPGRPVYGNRSLNTNESCGPMTVKKSYPDGSVEEKTFACPNDALLYEEQTSRQGESNSSAPPHYKSTVVVPHVLETKGMISGRITWSSSSATSGIVTNRTIKQESTRTTPNTSFGEKVRSGLAATIYAREAGSGMATGKRAREAGSGMATGRRQYQPLFIEGQGDVCAPCLATITSNPLYSDKGTKGENPLFESKNNARTGGDEDCDGVAGLDVLLLNGNREVVARTTTENCGNFWFANVPEGSYIVKVTGSITGNKTYGVHVNDKGNYDVAGELLMPDDQWNIALQTSNNNTAARINTSRSNIKNVLLIEADTNGDGELDSYKVIATLSDGSSMDISSKTIINTSRSNIKQITIPLSSGPSGTANKTVNTTRSNIKHLTIAVGDLDGDGGLDYTVTGTFSDGSTRDVTQDARSTHQTRVIQINVDLADTDGDGASDLVWSPRSNTSIRATATTSNDPETVYNALSTHKMLGLASGDLDGDGRADIRVGNSYFEKGDRPTQEQRTTILGGALPGGGILSSALSPGDPIPGLDVKLIRSNNQTQTTPTNEFGEFEFTGLKEGDYTIATTLHYFIDDETMVTLENDTEETTDNDGLKKLLSTKGAIKVSASQNGQTLRATQPDNQSNNEVKGSPASYTTSTTTSASSISTGSLIEADLDGDGRFENSFLNFNDAIATIAITEAGVGKLVEKATSGVKQTMQTQVRMASGTGPVKWMAPEAAARKVWGDPHVDEKDGSLKMGEGAFDKVEKGKWKSSSVTVKTVKCQDGTCRIVTSKPEDYSDAVAVSLNSLPTGTPIGNAAVWLTDGNGNVYKEITDANGRLRLNKLPAGKPIAMKLNLLVPGDEDVLVKFYNDNGTVQLLKTKHDTVKNSINNVR